MLLFWINIVGDDALIVPRAGRGSGPYRPQFNNVDIVAQITHHTYCAYVGAVFDRPRAHTRVRPYGE